MKKPKPLTDRQKDAINQAEKTLFGDFKIPEGFGRVLRGLRLRGLAEGDKPHVYLTEAGISARGAE